MEDGAVGVGALGEIPGPLGVDALVVVEGSGAEIPEAQGEGGREDEDVRDQQPVHVDAAGQQAVEGIPPGGWAGTGGHGALT